MPLKNGAKPRRLTKGELPEFHPSWSPDGRSIVFVTWNAKQAGHVWVVPTHGGVPRQISDAAAYYTHPVYEPSGHSVLVVLSDNRARLHSLMEYGQQVREAALVSLPLSGGPARTVTAGTIGGKPHFGPEPGVAYLQTMSGLGAVNLVSGEMTPVECEARLVFRRRHGVDDIRVSPDGQTVLALIAQRLHVCASTGKGGRSSNPGLAHRRITDVGAGFFQWADGGKTITWSVGSTYSAGHWRISPSIPPIGLIGPPTCRAWGMERVHSRP
jgi:hypothetical protein